MTTIETQVENHYSNRALLSEIFAGWETLKTQSQAAPVDQLAGVDEFHIGGRAATEIVCAQMRLAPGQKVLDVGCGLGGAARFMAERYGVQVEGVDLTADYVEAGNQLTREVGLSKQVNLAQCNALSLPHLDGAFDRASLFHVAMNIEDKVALFAELARVLKPGGLLAVYDVMRLGDAELAYPVAWAQDETTSFVDSPDTYRDAMERAGLTVGEPELKKQLGLDFFAAMKARMAKSGPPPLGLHLVMGKDASVKAGNMAGNITSGAIAPVLVLAQRA